jgi:hypothetical protein
VKVKLVTCFDFLRPLSAIFTTCFGLQRSLVLVNVKLITPLDFFRPLMLSLLLALACQVPGVSEC